MRLDELTGYHERPETASVVNGLKDLDDKPKGWKRHLILRRFLRDLESQGYERIGNGMFGAVVGHQNLDYVIKVFRNDPAYLFFVKYALENQDNRHLPKFRGKFMRLDEDYYAVRMERLRPIVHGDPIMAIVAYCRMYLPDEISSVKGVIDWMYVRKEHMENYLRQAMELPLSRLERDPSVLQTFLDLREIAAANGFLIDINHQNCMLRGNCLVYTDPFWYQQAVS